MQADTDQALRNMSSLFGSFGLTEQHANLKKKSPWKPAHKNLAQGDVATTEKDTQTSKADAQKKVDEILDVSADEDVEETEVKEHKPEEVKKKKNRRKKRTRKQK